MSLNNFVRFAALVSIFSLMFLRTRLPPPILATEVVLLLLWVHMEWDLRRKRK